MKYRFFYLLVIIMLLLGITVNAADYEYTIKPSDNFIAVYSGDDLTEISEKLNMSPTELNTYFGENGLLYLAVSNDTKTQIKISAFSDNFSSEVSDISLLDDMGLTEFINAVSDDSDSPAQLVENGGRKYLCIKNTLSDSGGVYTVTQYITICNNKTYYFAGYNPGEDTSDEVTAIFKSFSLNENASQDVKAQKTKINKQYFFINCGVVCFTIIAVLSLVGIIRHQFRKARKNENEN